MKAIDVDLGGNRALRLTSIEWQSADGPVRSVRLALAWATNPGEDGPGFMVPADALPALVDALTRLQEVDG